MADFKMNAGEVLIAGLNAMQYAFESHKDKENVKNMELFRQAAIHMPVTKMDRGIYYRARIIKDSDGEETGIIRNSRGEPISGYNIQYSGAPSEDKVIENGRVNRIGESVLYIAEDEETSCKEQKPNETDYLSVAKCAFNCDINVMDFTFTTSKELDTIFTENVISYFEASDNCDIRALYIFICNYFTSPNFKDIDYDTTLNLLDIIKQRKDISGVKYFSSYTKKYNIALWDDNRYSKCTDSKVKGPALHD